MLRTRRRHRENDAPRVRRRSLLRRIDIGPRLWFFIAIPAIGMVVLVSTLVASDVRTLVDVDRFEQTTGRIVELVEMKNEIQDERHLLAAEDVELRDRPLATELLGTRIVAFLNSEQTAVDIGEELLAARALADSGQTADALARYNRLINVVERSIDRQVGRTPTAELDRRGDALTSLLAAEEAARLEDLEIRLALADPLSITRLHTVEIESLRAYTERTGASGFDQLEQLTITDAWADANLLRTELIDASHRGVDLAAWETAADDRIAGMGALVDHEATSLAMDTSALRNAHLDRLLFLSLLVAAVLIVAALAALSIRRSIVAPLGRLANAASRLSEGSLERVDDNATDEIATVGRAFSSLHETMASLWSDIDEIERSVREKDFDRRVRTENLTGDWRRLADTMNATLDTGAEHNTNVRAELLRREVLSEVTSASLAAENGRSLTALVLRALPGVVPGSHVHLHQHASGTPIYDLGVPLEPTISALEMPAAGETAAVVNLSDDQRGIAAIVDFGSGPPAVLVLEFGYAVPEDFGPLLSIVDTAANVLAQGHRRQIAEWSAAHNLEHDALTGLRNATGLQAWIGKQDPTARTIIGIEPLGVERVDATNGREARNALLSIVARRLHPLIGEQDLLCRIGDPEFVVVTTPERADELASRIARSFDHPVAVNNDLVSVNVGIGVAPVGDVVTEAVANAATAIRHRASTTTSVSYFENRLREVDVRFAEIERWLEDAVETGDLTVVYQPVVNAVTTEPEGYECLVRGTRNGVSIPPDEFVPIAEQSNAITAIGDFTLREACDALPFLPGASPYVAVNLSPAQLSEPGLLHRIDAVLTTAGVQRDRIVFEITEGVMTSDEDIELLHQIRELGVRIAIDDFGSGHANLAYLSNLPADIVKLDKSLIEPMTTDASAHTVVAGAISMAHDLGLSVVGEGVETNEDLNALRRVRCDRVQGWLTGRPAPLAQLVDVAEQTHVPVPTTIVEPEVR